MNEFGIRFWWNKDTDHIFEKFAADKISARDNMHPESFYTIDIYNFQDHYTGKLPIEGSSTVKPFDYQNLEDIASTSEAIATYAIGKCMLLGNTHIRFCLPFVKEENHAKRSSDLPFYIASVQELTIRPEQVTHEKKEETKNNILSVTTAYLENALAYENDMITSINKKTGRKYELIVPKTTQLILTS